MHAVDYALIILYVCVQVGLGLSGTLRRNSSPKELIVGGRILTLPAFVASLVSTWYGGILGVGEYSYRYGLSNWLVFGVPYYLAAFLFAAFLARRARQSEVLTIPDRLASAYDRKTAVAGSIIIYLMTVPAAYILQLGILCQHLFHWSFAVGVLLGTLFSIVYVYAGGFNSLVRIDLYQFVFMFAGFILVFAFLTSSFGGLGFLQSHLPAEHFTWHGGKSGWYVATWYFIALETLMEPAFFQRCFAAKNVSVARRGIFLSILCWAIFDFLTTSCGMYARAILPNLKDPIASFPLLATEVLPVGLAGLFALAQLVTVMSTVDSYSFIAASTFGNDIVGRLRRHGDREIISYTRVGVLVSVALAVVLALYFRSVVEIWYVFGSIGTAALLVPVFTGFVGWRRLPPSAAFTTAVACGSLTTIWYCSNRFTAGGDYWLGLQPIFPGLLLSLLIFLLFARPVRSRSE